MIRKGKIYEKEGQIEAQNSSDSVSQAKQLIKSERNLGNFIKKFGTIAKDSKVAKFLEAADDLDKIVSKEVDGISAISLIPSQQEVGLGNSVADLISNPKKWDPTGVKTDSELTSILGNQPVRLTDKAGNLIVVAKCPGTNSKEDKYWIIDGHHRWSKAAVANPDVKLTCIVFEPSPESDLDIIGVLKAFHIANFKIKGESPTEPLSGENLLSCSDDEIKKFVNESEKTDNKLKIWKEKVQVSDWNEVTDLLISNRGKLAEARKKAPINSQETPTPRTVMPQVSNSKATANEFGKPAINVVVGESKKWIKTFEQFRNK
jgi:hypothetical protein